MKDYIFLSVVFIGVALIIGAVFILGTRVDREISCNNLQFESVLQVDSKCKYTVTGSTIIVLDTSIRELDELGGILKSNLVAIEAIEAIEVIDGKEISNTIPQPPKPEPSPIRFIREKDEGM